MVQSVKLDLPKSLPIQEGSEDKNVVVLATKFILTPPQNALLCKGLNFIPTEGSNRNIVEQSRWDIQQYHRRLKLAVYFQHKEDSDPPPFTSKSTWVPPAGTLPRELSTLFEADTTYFDKNFYMSPSTPNLTSEEVVALKQLTDNKQIVIKPADKGSAVVIMDRDQYLWEGYRQLGDIKYYSRLDKPIYPDTITLVDKITQSMFDKKFINAKQQHYIRGTSEPRARLFYMLPKIHKDPSKWSKPHEIPPGRPIVSDCSSETYHTAEFIDHHLNPLSVKHASYIKDTYDFVTRIRTLHIAQGSILFTMDVNSLYTNIDTAEGIQAVKNLFRRYPDKKRPEKELLQLLEINLTRNDFEFNGEFFLQIKGTAMGKKFAPAYANIFMAEWETAALASCHKKPTHYFRFLDDVWGVWPHSMEDFDSFLLTLNSHNESISLTSVTSYDSVDFLDTTTYKGQHFQNTNTLDVKVFFKDTDTHALLFKTSYHPKHTYAGLVKSQLLRFHRICSRKEDFRQATKTLFAALYTRGYSRSFLRKSFRTFLHTKPRLVASILPFVTTYSNSTVKLVRVIKHNFQNILTNNGVLPDHNIIAAFRKNKNLQSYLVKAKIPPMTSPKVKGQETFFQHRAWVRNRWNGDVYKTQERGCPQSRNCVYLITCDKCATQYVGETGNTIKIRFAQHKYNIIRKKETQTPLVAHFLLHGWQSVRARVLEANSDWTATLRRRCEKRWITKLDTVHPRGLNER